MPTTKKKRLQKLQKWRIWPSVAISIFFILISVLVVITFFGVFIINTTQTKYIDTINESEKLMKSVLTLCENDYTWDDIIGFIYTTGVTDSAAITDSDYSVIASCGKISFDTDDKKRIVVSEFMEEVFGESFSYDNLIMMPDLDSDNVGSLIDEEVSSFGIPIGRVVNDIIKNEPTGNENDSFGDEVLFSLDYWISTPIGDTGLKLLTKNSIQLYRNEFITIYMISILALSFLSIPVIFLIINIISGLISRGRIRRLLYIDSVTGGKSWLYVQNNAKRLLGGTGCPIFRWFFRSSSSKSAVINIKLQKYRSYCTLHGAEAGELILEQVDKQITQMLGKNEVCSRVEKAEFALILHGNSEEEIIDRVYAISEKVRSCTDAAHFTLHSGIYIVDGSVSDIDLMYNYAVAARTTVNPVEDTKAVLFAPEMLDSQIWVNKVEECMDEALKNEEFIVYLQPKYDPVSERLIGAEALIRWVSPLYGFVSPGKFIPIFERNGFITKIDDYMLEHVAQQQAEWISRGIPIVPISVNISRTHFAQPDLADHIAEIVDRYNVPHNVIEIELTESAFFDDKQALLTTINKLKEYDFEISMDDFGAGYSSLNSLKDLPLDVLKLDAEFFRGNSDKKRSEIVVAEAIRLAKSLDMKTVAEGIEKKEQVDFLADQGCDMIQGYYFAKPMPIEEFEVKHWNNSTVTLCKE